MDEKLKVDSKGQTLLSRDQMCAINGGSLKETIAKLAIYSANFLFRMRICDSERIKGAL